MKVYLAGPMTGKPNYNCDAFFNTEEGLGFLGHQVRTPFHSNNIIWQKHYSRNFNPRKDKCDYGDPLLAEMIVENVKLIAWADAIVMLEGWENSKGTKAELLIATLLHRKVFEQSHTGDFHQITHKIAPSVLIERVPPQ